MKIISYKDSAFDQQIRPLFERSAYPEEIEKNVRKILKDVRKNGNKALCRYALEFDKVELNPDTLRVSEKEIKKAEKLVSDQNKTAINAAIDNIAKFAKKQIPKPWSFTPRAGVIVGERFEPIDRVGVYIPGGTAPLVSTVIHTAGIAKTAGVKEIVAVTPPGVNGRILPELLYAMKKAGVTEIYRLGGVYAIGALAYGTENITKVEKIVGPGNAYVTAAKKIVYGEVAIDMIAGPSEIMIIADEKVNPKNIAADLLSQAEHGSGLEQAVLLSTSMQVIKQVEKCLIKQMSSLSRIEAVKKVMENGIFLIEVEDMDSAAEIATKYAPEHLEIICKQPGSIAKKVKAAGAIFLGEWTPECVGDFVAGPSHVLPTGGSAKFFSGLTAEHFFRRMSIINYQKKALVREDKFIEAFGTMEGLQAHRKSSEFRVSNDSKD
jgi:histidinol dehydrogenase